MIALDYPARTDYQHDLRDAYDVVVIGGGPAGSTVGALLAEAGHQVVVLERSALPRFHVGESLIPGTYWPLKRLGLIEQLKASAFPKKFSVQFFSDGSKPSAPFYFDEYNNHESSQTWQVERADFDTMLLDNAVAKGGHVRTEAQVLEVLFEDGRARGVRVKLGRGAAAETREIVCRVVADASGQSSFLVNRLNLKTTDPWLRKGTVWTYFRGARRDTGKDEGATLIMQTAGKRSWFWYIPLRDDIVSVGCTGSMDYMFPQGSTPAATFERELANCPALAERLECAVRHTDYLTTKDYSYRSRQPAGPGWVLLGDACGFIDPVYSSGVHLALCSGEFVADTIDAGLREDDVSAERLQAWYPEYAAGVENFRRLVYAFYAPDFSFGEFLREHPEHHSRLVDILVGDVFKPDVCRIFDDMGEIFPPADMGST
jgi:flavin-dependent dehydrogenase